MRAVIVLWVALNVMTACGRSPNRAQMHYDSAHSLALTGFIEDGLLKTTSTDAAVIRAEINRQLLYAIGQLNGLDGVGDHANSLAKSIAIKSSHVLPEGGFLVTYTAQMTLSWSRRVSIPQSLFLILPESVDFAFGMPQKYFDRYAVNACLDEATHSLGLGNFWYYVRPHQVRCPLGRGPVPGDLTVRIPMRLAMSSINTEGKSPEYHKFWEDGRLVVSAVFSTYAPINDPSDVGVRQYGAFYRDMVLAFGPPVRSSADIPVMGPGREHPYVELEFKSSQGSIELYMFLVDGLVGNGAEFDRLLGDASLMSDIIMYHGHSGLGSNVRGLAQKIRTKKDQYHLIVVNSCDTFAYMDDTLMLKHKSANPNATDYKFVDIITNAMPSSFANLADTAMVITHAAVGQRQTYRQILARIDEDQHASVMGEEDND
jgi:hypothetical protein